MTCARVRTSFGSRSPLACSLAAAIEVFLMASSLSAQQPPKQQTPAELLRDFTHYAIVAHVEMAEASAQALINTGITNAEFAQLLDEGPVTREAWDDSIQRAMRVPELEAIAADLARRAEAGRLDLAREPKRIEEAVQMLIGTQRQQLLGEQRLIAAGEYAVPPLVRAIVEGREERLKLAAERTLIKIGQQAVTPLAVGLLHLNGQPQRIIADVLGSIGHPQAAPYLREVSMNAGVDAVAREAAQRAFNRLGVPDGPLSHLYAALARNYFDGHESLIAFPDESHNNIWTYNDFTGLTPVQVPTPVFTEVMAMKLASKALALDASNSDALSLFVASNLKRENDLPEGATDPVYGDNQYTADFYATVFGTQNALNVLGLAIDKLDTPLVRDAINALAKTTGGANLFARGSGRNPLLEAMGYPDRRVQYEAALTLARALPQERFPSDQSVVPILASAVRSSDQPLAVVIADDDENQRNHVSQLGQMNFQIVAAGGSVNEVQQDIAGAIGVDLIVIRVIDAPAARQTVTSVRAISKASAAPILIFAGGTDQTSLRQEYRDDQRVTVVRAGVDAEALTIATNTVMQQASGGRITEAEAEEYAIRALDALRDVAISRSPAYTIADAESALIDALATRSGGTRLLVAEILALIPTDAAQRTLFDAALAATAEEQVELLKRVADSVRIWGDRAEKRHVEALVALVGSSSGETAEAAATVHGALNLPTSEAVQLVPKEG